MIVSHCTRVLSRRYYAGQNILVKCQVFYNARYEDVIYQDIDVSLEQEVEELRILRYHAYKVSSYYA